MIHFIFLILLLRKYLLFLQENTYIHIFIVSTSEAGSADAPCLPGNICLDNNSVCAQGICRCNPGYYAKEGQCCMYSFLWPNDTTLMVVIILMYTLYYVNMLYTEN